MGQKGLINKLKDTSLNRRNLLVDDSLHRVCQGGIWLRYTTCNGSLEASVVVLWWEGGGEHL